MLYNVSKKDFVELKGEGIALGVDESYHYKKNEINEVSQDNIVFFYTDGIWEIHNSDGERFGEKRFCRVIEQNSHLSSQQILQSVIDELKNSRSGIGISFLFASRHTSSRVHVTAAFFASGRHASWEKTTL